MPELTDPPAPATPGEALFRYEYRDRPHVWSQWPDTDDGFRARYELEAAKIVGAVPSAPAIVVVDR